MSIESLGDTSLSLLERARNQDQEAWKRLVDLYSPLVASWCLKSGLNSNDCADVVQDVLAAVARNLREFRRDKSGGSFRGWLRVIAQNKLRDHFRNRAQEPAATGGSAARKRWNQLAQTDPGGLDSDEEEVSSLFSRALEMVRGEFESGTWQAFWKVAVEGCPSAEAAADLEMTPGAVRQAKYKVLRRLRQELGDVLEWPGQQSPTGDPGP